MYFNQEKSFRSMKNSVVHADAFIYNFTYTYIFSKIMLDGSHLSDNGIYCSIMNIGDVNSY